jgi:hypothetical protein
LTASAAGAAEVRGRKCLVALPRTSIYRKSHENATKPAKMGFMT